MKLKILHIMPPLVIILSIIVIALCFKIEEYEDSLSLCITEIKELNIENEKLYDLLELSITSLNNQQQLDSMRLENATP